MLKPCPFCGGEGGIGTSASGARFWAECVGCGVSFGWLHPSRRQARDEWNRRDNEARIRREALLEAAKIAHRKMQTIWIINQYESGQADEAGRRVSAAILALIEDAES